MDNNDSDAQIRESEGSEVESTVRSSVANDSRVPDRTLEHVSPSESRVTVVAEKSAVNVRSVDKTSVHKTQSNVSPGGMHVSPTDGSVGCTKLPQFFKNPNSSVLIHQHHQYSHPHNTLLNNTDEKSNSNSPNVPTPTVSGSLGYNYAAPSADLANFRPLDEGHQITHSDKKLQRPPNTFQVSQVLDSGSACGNTGDSVSNKTADESIQIELPSCCTWFDMNSINPLEREQLPSLFGDVVARGGVSVSNIYSSVLTAESNNVGNENENKNFFTNDASASENVKTDIKQNVIKASNSLMGLAELDIAYMTMRNAIITLYRSDVTKYISYTECRRVVNGDASALMRLHSFLDYWGLINFQVLPKNIPSRAKPLRDISIVDLEKRFNERKNISDAIYEGNFESNPGIMHDKHKNLYPDDVATATHAAEKFGSNGYEKQTSFDISANGPWKCVSCGKICLYSYYILNKNGMPPISLGLISKCVWCVKCHSDGLYPSVFLQRNFIKVTIPIGSIHNATDADNWNREKLERLIEGIELYGERWNSVANHVGQNVTATECIEKFITIPICEPFTDEIHSGNNDSKDPVNADSIPPYIHDPLSFSDSSRPLLTHLSFIASVVSPNVAAAAAKAAFDELMKEERKKRGFHNDLIITQAKSTVKNTTHHGSDYDENHTSNHDKNHTSNYDDNSKKRSNMRGGNDKDNGDKRRKVEKDIELSEKVLKEFEKLPISPPGYISSAEVQIASASAIAASAVRARELAAVEEEEMKKLLPDILEASVEAMNLKIQRLEEIEKLVKSEKKTIESRFTHVVKERKAYITAALQGS